MVRTQKQTFTTARLFRSLMFVCAVFYLSYHALHGERGLYALVKENRERAVLSEQLEQTTADRARMELRVSHMRDGSLDLDLLDEQMRRMLGVMKTGEVIVLTGQSS